MSDYNLQRINKFLPKKLKTRINKTRLARGGNGIYKRRNRRSYRVLMKYKTWEDLNNNIEGEKILNSFEEGYVVYLEPEEYFGENYPNASEKLNKNFKLGETGFILYTVMPEYNKYPPLDEWNEVYELNTNGKKVNDDSWTGDYALDIKNGRKMSTICIPKKNTEKEIISQKVKEMFNIEGKAPEQSGLGNYEYDYANEETIDNVKFQILFLLLNSNSEDGQSSFEFIYDNSEKLMDAGETNTFKKYMSGPRDKYLNDAMNEFKLFSSACYEKKLLNFLELEKLGVWNTKTKKAICPLCRKPIFIEEFFKDIEQMEGRQVLDNTQKEIVLMHVNALRPGKLNHRPYNLGWGHNYCNLIQGDEDIFETIEKLKEIVDSHNLN